MPVRKHLGQWEMNGDVDGRSYKSNAISGSKVNKKINKITASEQAVVAVQEPRLAI